MVTRPPFFFKAETALCGGHQGEVETLHSECNGYVIDMEAGTLVQDSLRRCISYDISHELYKAMCYKLKNYMGRLCLILM